MTSSARASGRRAALRKKRNKKDRSKVVFCSVILSVLICACVAAALIIYVYNKNKKIVSDLEADRYGNGVLKLSQITDSLCVADGDVALPGFSRGGDDAFRAAGLFDVERGITLYADHLFDKVYPASTTKILTAMLALKYGNPGDIVTITDSIYSIPSDSSKARLISGDKLTLSDLLYAMMLPSGNDAAVAVAEHISGSVEAFVELMNSEAYKIGATSSHFVNPHGYHDENHYTTAYDLYLIFNECVKYDAFRKIISSPSYETVVQRPDGTSRGVVWRQTNQFVNGSFPTPQGANLKVIGGKTGTTDEAGCCLINLSASDGHPFISVVTGAKDYGVLYGSTQKLTELGSVNGYVALTAAGF